MNKITAALAGTALAAAAATMLATAPNAAAIYSPNNPAPVCSKTMHLTAAHLQVRECVSQTRVANGTRVHATLYVSTTNHTIRSVHAVQRLAVRYSNGAVAYRSFAPRTVSVWPAGSIARPVVLSSSIVLPKGAHVAAQGTAGHYAVRTAYIRTAF